MRQSMRQSRDDAGPVAAQKPPPMSMPPPMSACAGDGSRALLARLCRLRRPAPPPAIPAHTATGSKPPTAGAHAVRRHGIGNEQAAQKARASTHHRRASGAHAAAKPPLRLHHVRACAGWAAGAVLSKSRPLVGKAAVRAQGAVLTHQGQAGLRPHTLLRRQRRDGRRHARVRRRVARPTVIARRWVAVGGRHGPVAAVLRRGQERLAIGRRHGRRVGGCSRVT